MNEFFAMGGYAFYVWVSYGISLLVLVLNFILPRAREKALMQRISRASRKNAGVNG